MQVDMKGLIILTVLFLSMTDGHSVLGYPKPMSSKECHLGGTPPGPIRTCPGPCDPGPFFRNPDINGPEKPSAVWGRGENVTIKYQRNNHGPGGFVRMSIIPINRMMSKDAHEQNAFHYSCWGGGFVVARKEEIVRDKNGFSLTGNDGNDHNLPIGYYSSNVTIPTVIPDGWYVLSWVWYGGIGGSIFKNTPDSPFPNGFFSDMWSCAFIQIKGGKPMEKWNKPVFEPNLKKHWGNTCWSANNAPGVCKYGPCKKPIGGFLRPLPFTNDKFPPLLKPFMFRSPSSCSELGNSFGSSCNPGPVPSPIAPQKVARDAITNLLRLQG